MSKQHTARKKRIRRNRWIDRKKEQVRKEISNTRKTK